MHNYHFYITFPAILFLLLFGCRNPTGSNITEETHHVSMKGGETFEYQTGISGDEEGVHIVRQPTNYEISTIIRDSTTKWEAVYQYQPEAGFKGTQSVELKLLTGSDGASPNNKITLVKLNIMVN